MPGPARGELHGLEGQAALMLVEGLLHALVDSSALTKSQALRVIESAIAVTRESAGAGQGAAEAHVASLARLERIRASFALRPEA